MVDNQNSKVNDAGYSFNETPFVEPEKNKDGQTYDQVRGDDESQSTIQNSDNLQFTREQPAEKDKETYLRLIMPKYTRRVEIEDLDRNFWVIGQAIDNLAYYAISEKTHIEITKEKDRDGNDYSNYPHKIVFNEGYNGIRTPFIVKDYCYRSNKSNTYYEDDCLWSRQIGGYNSPDNAYKIGSYGTIPFLNFYKPRPDAIPIFSLVQTESSDTETHSTDTPILNGQEDLNIEGSNFKGRYNGTLWHGKKDSDHINPTKGDIYVCNTYELCPIEGDILPEGEFLDIQGDVKMPNGTVSSFENFSEGQIIKISGSQQEYVKTVLMDNGQRVIYSKDGFTYPKDYQWSLIGSSSTKQLTLNFIDQRFMWNGDYWQNLDQIYSSDGPALPQYQVVENGSIFRVLGDSDIKIIPDDTSDPTEPIINGKAFPIVSIRDHDVVRDMSPISDSNPTPRNICYEWWNGAWRQIHNCDASYVNIFIWFPQKTSTLRSMFYWTLKWLIPPGLAEYN